MSRSGMLGHIGTTPQTAMAVQDFLAKECGKKVYNDYTEFVVILAWWSFLSLLGINGAVFCYMY